MIYKTLDGIVLESGSNPVSHTCNCNMPDGIYTSLETTSAATPIGIQQIKVERTVVNNVMTVVITESTEQELQDYISQIQNNI